MSYTSWYREGTVSVTNGSNIVTGSKTFWSTAGIHAGDIFKLKGLDYEIGEVISDTSITLTEPVKAVSGNNYSYAIIRNFSATMSTEVAAKTIQLLGYFMKYIDTDIQKITGKSAYDLAVENGFTGTLAQWLESLKAAQEWSNLDERTSILTSSNAGLHNSIFRGKNLGSVITPAQMAAIRDGSFSGLWLGDGWKIGSNTYIIVHFNYYSKLHTENTISDGKTENPLRSKPHVVLVNSGFLYDAEGTEIHARWSSTSNIVPEGGYFASELSAAYDDEGAVMKQIISDLGEENLQQFRIQACNSFENGECKSYSSKLVRACPPTERQIFGERIDSIENRDPYNERVFAITHAASYACPGVWGMKSLREIAGSNAICENHYGRSGVVTPNNPNAGEILAMCVLG